MLNIALPKGRLGDKVYKLLDEIGYECKDIYEDNRKLIFENKAIGVRYFLVKPSDVAIYVEHGAADIGIVGKDILLESAAQVYELLDLRLGKCRICTAAKNDYIEDAGRTLRVATKFVNVAKRYFATKNTEIEIIHLNGSIELAPILDLSDIIVDIVESGNTLKENNLKVLEEIVPVSARLIACKTSYVFKKEQIDTIAAKLKERVKND